MDKPTRPPEPNAEPSPKFDEPQAKHTPGPWRACKDGECQCGYIFGDGGNVYVAQALNEKNVDASGCPDPHPTLKTGLTA